MKKILSVSFTAFAAFIVLFFTFNNLNKNSNKINLEITNPDLTKISLDEQNNTFLGNPDKIYIYNIPCDQTYLQKGEDVSEYITVSPDLRGKWILEDDKPNLFKICFNPEKDWLANKQYKVSINKKIFKNPKKIKSLDLSFSTKENNVNIVDFGLWHDDNNLSLFGIEAVVKFDFPTEDSKISLKLNKKDVKPAISFDKHKRYCFIKYKPVTLTNQEQTANLKIFGKEQDLIIPDAGDFFKVKEIKTDILGKDKDAVQAIIIEFTDFVPVQEVEKNIEVYLLPSKTDWNTKSLKDAEKALNNSTKINVKAMPQDPSGRIVALKYDKPLDDRYLYIELKTALKSKSGYSLKKSEKYVEPITNFKSELKFIGYGNILSASGDKNLTICSRLINNIDVKIARFFPEKLNFFVSQNFYKTNNYYYQDEEYYDNYYNRYYEMQDEDIAEIFNKRINISGGININYSSIDLNKYIKNGKMGLFAVEISADGITRRKFILISDIGIVYKEDVDNKIKLFAVSLSTGKPLDNARVCLLARNGTELMIKNTDFDGVCNFEDISSFINEKEPVAFIVSKDDDVSFIPIQRGGRDIVYSRYDTSGKSISEIRDKQVDSYIFTDRGIYKPGETVKFSVILRNEKNTVLTGFPINIEIENPDGKIIFDKNISSPANGFIESEFLSQATSKTGTYRINIYSGANKNYRKFVSSIEFKIEEFKEDKLKIETTVEGDIHKGWMPLEGLSGKVKLQNLYGMPAQGNEIKAETTLIPSAFSFKEYKDYIFSDFVLDNKANIKNIHETLESKKTSSSGEISYDLSLSQYETGTYRLLFFAEGFERESGSSVKSSVQQFVSPNKYILGYKTLSNLNYLDKNSKPVINLIAVDNDLKKINLNKLKLKTYNVQYVSVPVKEYNGRYKYHSIAQADEISSKDFSVSEKSTDFNLDTSVSGNYKVEIIDENNNKLLSLEYVVVGGATLGYQLEKNSELLINLRKDAVKAGEELEFNVTSPFKGIGLVTIESDKVHAYKWFTMDTNSKLLKITVPQNISDGAYLNISVLKDKNAKEIFLNPHSYALKYFKILSDTTKEVKPEITVPETVKPGTDLKIGYSTSKPAKIILYGVDEGILQYAKYKTPNPLSYFSRKPALDVNSYQTLDLFLPEFSVIKEVYGIGGDGAYDAEALLNAGLNPFKRKVQAPAVFWSGIINSDKISKTYTYKVPDYFNGSLRIMCIAVGENFSFGSSEKSVVVRAPIVLSAGAPLVAAPSDVFDVTLKIANSKQDLKKADLTVNISVSDNLKVTEEKTKNIIIENGNEDTVSFKVKALDKLGNATIDFSVNDKISDDKSKISATLSIRPASIYATDIVTGKDKRESFKVTNFKNIDSYNEFANKNIVVSNNPLVMALGLENYLEKFPHGCTEQITSQTYPSVVLYGLTKESQTIFNRYIEKLGARQKFNGGFSSWQDSNYISDDTSLYVLQFLTDAKNSGYNVPETMFRKLLDWTRNFIKYPANEYEAGLQAKALYLLARNSESFTGQLSKLESYFEDNVKDWTKTIHGAYIASTYKLLQNKDRAEEIIKKFETEKGVNYYSDYDSSSIRNMTYIYLISNHFPELLNNSNVTDMIQNTADNIINKDYNTLSSAKTILAVASYSKANEYKDENIEIFIDGKKAETTKNKSGFMQTAVPADSKDIQLKSSSAGNLGLFYTITQQGFFKDKKQNVSEGLKIDKKYLNKDGNETNTAELGDEVTVKITVKTTDDKHLENIAVTDLLPGGLNIIPGSLEGAFDSFDIREDRILIYTSAEGNAKEFTYKTKAVSSGVFVQPAVEANHLYDVKKYAVSKDNIFKVNPRK